MDYSIEYEKSSGTLFAKIDEARALLAEIRGNHA